MDDADLEKAKARVGTTVASKYKLGRVLGVGGMGAVYAAVHQITRKNVAVKLLDPTISRIEGYAQRFQREARAANEIAHPSIVDVIDAGEEPDGSLYLILELLEGRSLAEAIERDQDLTTDEVVDIAVQTLDGLAAAHDRGIVHRDVKPENIFLTRDEHGNQRVKLLDFGVAKKTRKESMQVSTRIGAILGTPYYMSPEQAVGGGDVDGRADLWSTGAVIFRALAGRPPLEDESWHRLLVRLAGGERPKSLHELRPDLPKWLTDVTDRALEPDRAKRWRSASQMAIALRARDVGTEITSLDWDAAEDATVQTASPYHRDSDAPRSIPVPMVEPTGELPAPASGAQRLPQGDLSTTMAARPGAISAPPEPPPEPALKLGLATPRIAPDPPGTSTPKVWEAPVPPPPPQPVTAPRRVLPLILIGGVALSVVGIVSVVAALALMKDDSFRTTPLPRPVASPRPPSPAPFAVGVVDDRVLAHGATVLVHGTGLRGATAVTVAGVPQQFGAVDDSTLRVGPISDRTTPGRGALVVSRGDEDGAPLEVVVLHLVVSEIEAHTLSPDGPFVELSTGVGGASLLGYQLAAHDLLGRAYLVIPLAANADANGHLVVGGEASDIRLTGELQRDGALVVVKRPEPIEVGSQLDHAGLIDAVVYARHAAPDAVAPLLERLVPPGAARTPAEGDTTGRSLQRCAPVRREPSAFRAGPPTPGAANNCN